MSRRFTIPVVTALCLSFIATHAPDAAAQKKVGEAAALFLFITNSARVNGMGGCALNVVNEQSPLYNPGALGLFHLDKVFSVSFPNSTDWLPQIDSDLKLKSFEISGGVSARRITSADTDYDIGIGLAYSSLKMDYGVINIADVSGNTVGTTHDIDKADYYSAGIGIEYFARLGVGVTKKKIHSNLAAFDSNENLIFANAEADAYDFGLIVDLPMANLVQRALRPDRTLPPDYEVTFTPSFAYVYANGGDSIAYIDAANASPLPRMRKIGVGGYGALAYQGATIFSLQMCWQRDRWEIGEPYKIYRQGGEWGLMDAVFFRFGSYADVAGQVSYNTFGVGLSLHGVMEWLLLTRPEIDNGILRYLATHVDFTVDYAKYGGIDTPLDETAFANLTFSF